MIKSPIERRFTSTLVRSLAIAASLFAFSALAAAREHPYSPSFRPADLSDRPATRQNRVLVLGTPHLSAIAGDIDARTAEPLLARLARWRPTAIAVENISGLGCHAMRQQGARQSSAVDAYCFDTSLAERATGLDVPAAVVEVDRILDTWPAKPTPADRRRLAVLFLAAGEPGSAMVQWFRLASRARRPEGALSGDLTAVLQERASRKSEDDLIAARLAARLGHERLWAMDDQSFVSAPVDEAAYGAALTRAWDNPVNRARTARDEELIARVAQPQGLLDLYRAFNEPEYALQKYESDWGPALIEPSPLAYGRRYVAYWETRNLRMAANIREVLGRDPGMRMLVIAGASHKGYLEAYLGQMRDIVLDDVEPVLGHLEPRDLRDR